MSKSPRVEFRNIEPLQDYYINAAGEIYSVARLVDEASKRKQFMFPLAAVNLSDEIWKGYSMFELAWHIKRVMKADLTKPIIFDWNGEIADGRHRILKALAEGYRELPAVRLIFKLEPDGHEDG